MDLQEKLIAKSVKPKVVTILRAASNAGKSTFADYLQANILETAVCCADFFFEDVEGNYKFVPSKIKEAHEFCKESFQRYLNLSVPNIIIANTNTSEWEFEYYKTEAEKRGYMVFTVVIEKRHDENNDHGVPTDVLQRQEANIKKSLKLT